MGAVILSHYTRNQQMLVFETKQRSRAVGANYDGGEQGVLLQMNVYYSLTDNLPDRPEIAPLVF